LKQLQGPSLPNQQDQQQNALTAQITHCQVCVLCACVFVCVCVCMCVWCVSACGAVYGVMMRILL
jgi:hypothetical protein